jgi:hypothetical protein
MIRKKRDFDVAHADKGTLKKLNIEDLSEDERREFHTRVSETSQLELYTGHVEHGYALGAVSTSESCPRCQALTRQQYANFIYATQIAPRVMFAPAGYFCTACPTVVIDEELIRPGISKQFTYQGVVGLDHEGEKRPDFFKTWNGETTVYLFDEHENPVGLTTTARLQSKGFTKNKRPSDRRRQMAKASRKRNRRKR